MYRCKGASLVAQSVKNLPQFRRTGLYPWVQNIPWRRKQQPTPVFLPGKSHWQRSQVGYSPEGCKELDTTEWLTHTHRCESCKEISLCETIKKAEHWRIDDFKLWVWRRLLRTLWTAKRSNQSTLKEINLEYSLEGLMLKHQYLATWSKEPTH